MKVLHIGSNSPHVIGYINDFKFPEVEHLFIGNESVDIANCSKSFGVNFQHLNPIKLYKSYRKAQQIIKQEKPDVIHIHQVVRNSFWMGKIAKKLNIPTVVTAWGSDVLIMPFKNKLFYHLVESTLSQANIITADAKVMIDKMKEIVPNKRYEWIQYGINLVESKPKENIIYSNRLHKPLYNIDKIIDLFYDFQQENQNFQLKIAAIGEETDSLKQKVNDLNLNDKVTFLGWLTNDKNRSHYETARIYVSIPDSDGTSVSLLEAMSAGCIPVVSELPANKEWIDNGENGVIHSPNKNPFIEALKLDPKVVADTNRDRTKIATRENSVAKFYQFYKELSNI